MGSHQSANSDSTKWLTPPFILEELGPFDLDPCAPIDRPWEMADNHYTEVDDGLSEYWYGRIWCNPPYGREAVKWLNKLSQHGDGIALIFARTETQMFFDQVWEKADGLLFIDGRLYFHKPDGRRAENNSGAPSVLVSYGVDNSKCLKDCNIPGAFIPSWSITGRQSKSWKNVEEV
jgi:hypothetical protein